MLKSPLPKKFVGTDPSIRILEAVIADRVSIGTKPISDMGVHHAVNIACEAHVVIGLKLEGMSNIGYIWSKVDKGSGDRDATTWRDTTVSCLRNDVPAPLFELFPKHTGKESQIGVVKKESMMIHVRRSSDKLLLLPVQDPGDHICDLRKCFPDIR